MDHAFPTPTNSLNPSYSSDGTKVSLPSRGTIQAFYQLICPWYQSQFEHYLVHNLGRKPWLHKGKMTFWYRMAMVFLGLQRKFWLKWNSPPPRLGNCKAGSFSICNWKHLGCYSVFIPVPKKGNDKECSNCHTVALISHASKVMLKILQVRLQQYVNCELPVVQAGFRKGRRTRDQIFNIHWIKEKARVPEKHLFLLYWLCQSLWLCGSQ